MASYAAMRRIFPEGGLSPVCARKNRAWSPELRQVRRYFDLQKRLTDNYMILVDIKNDTALLSRNFLQDFGVRGDTMSRIRGEWLASSNRTGSWRRVGLVTLAAFGLSLCIECLQLLLKVGFFELTDLVVNTLGAFVGAGGAFMIRRFLRSLTLGRNDKRDSDARSK